MFWNVPRAYTRQNSEFEGIDCRTSYATRCGTTTLPFHRSMRQLTSAGDTGRPCQVPGTESDGESYASASISMRPRIRFGIGAESVFNAPNEIDRTNGRVIS